VAEADDEVFAVAVAVLPADGEAQADSDAMRMMTAG
jgi:hypothetical protein